ncbi:MAG: hypothetical protein P8X46_04710 [Nitrospirales bacterium]|jgi:hypothetical protein
MRWRFVFLFPSSNSLSRLQALVISSLAFAIVFPRIEVWGQPVELPRAGTVEFSARLAWKTGGRLAKAQLFVKKDRYRIEPSGGIRTDLGYASVTIVRLDEQKIWYVLSQRRMIVSVPLTSDYLLPFSVQLEGETSRTFIGDSVVGTQPALLYDIVVQDRYGQTERYFEWVDPGRNILLKLLSQDRDWFVEYHHVVVSPQPDYFFEAPLGYRIIEAQEARVPKG